MHCTVESLRFSYESQEVRGRVPQQVVVIPGVNELQEDISQALQCQEYFGAYIPADALSYSDLIDEVGEASSCQSES